MSSQAVIASVMGPHPDPLLEASVRSQRSEEEEVLVRGQAAIQNLQAEDPLLPGRYLTSTSTLYSTLQRGEDYAHLTYPFAYILPKMHAAQHNPLPLMTYDYTYFIACDANFRAGRRVTHGEVDPRFHSASARQLMLLRTFRGPHQLEQVRYQTICPACPRQEVELAERFEEVDTEEAEGV
ncbi:hypothetical protein C8R47DRAFT_1074878 [Mycena vitilis]|nr:hypothetical protein C8R47DRAFT_1074878 [Mycena vitilis]